MMANVGGIDRIARIVLGVALIGLAATGIIGLWGYIGVVPLVTGIINYCPLYPLINFSTAKKGL